MRDPHQNIFYYYRGPSSKESKGAFDVQVEDNTTKAFVNLLELTDKVGFEDFLKGFLSLVGFSSCKFISIRLQQSQLKSRPDAVINFGNRELHIESKVRARIDSEQIKNHLFALNTQDRLVLISDKMEKCPVNDARFCHIRWKDLYSLCIKLLAKISNNRNQLATVEILRQFIEYLEVQVMTDFVGIKNDDFDYWLHRDPRYASILIGRLKSLADAVKNVLPAAIRGKYSFIKDGNISHEAHDDRFAWVAIKKPNGQDCLNQCNFTLEIAKHYFQINAVIRNGRTTDKNKPLGIFSKKLESPAKFLSLINHLSPEIKKNGFIQISRRLPKKGPIIRGNERWIQFFEIKLREILTEDDVRYILQMLRRADSKEYEGQPSYPGFRAGLIIGRGDAILENPEALIKKVAVVIECLLPFLDFLEEL